MKIRINGRYYLNLGKLLNFILLLLGAICIAWWVCSYIDVLFYQGKGGTPHLWNVFNIITS